MAFCVGHFLSPEVKLRDGRSRRRRPCPGALVVWAVAGDACAADGLEQVTGRCPPRVQCVQSLVTYNPSPWREMLPDGQRLEPPPAAVAERGRLGRAPRQGSQPATAQAAVCQNQTYFFLDLLHDFLLLNVFSLCYICTLQRLNLILGMLCRRYNKLENL